MQKDNYKVTNLRCSSCGAALEFKLDHNVIKCEYCGTTNYLSYQNRGDKLKLVEDYIDEHDVEEELKNRIEIINNNLSCIDPIQEWREQPTISQNTKILCLTISGFGFLITFLNIILGVFIILIGLGIFIIKFSENSDNCALYERDLIISTKNNDLIKKLEYKKEQYSYLLNKLENKKGFKQ